MVNKVIRLNESLTSVIMIQKCNGSLGYFKMRLIDPDVQMPIWSVSLCFLSYALHNDNPLQAVGHTAQLPAPAGGVPARRGRAAPARDQLTAARTQEHRGLPHRLAVSAFKTASLAEGRVAKDQHLVFYLGLLFYSLISKARAFY